MNKRYKEFKQKFDRVVKESEIIYITSHINPDGDAISSVLSIYYYVTEVLRHPKEKVCPIFTGEYSENWEYFKYYSKVQFVEDISGVIKPNSTVILLDAKEIYRFTNNPEKFKQIKDLKTICIDHHPFPNSEKFDLSYTVEKTSHMSNAEIIYALFYREYLKNTPKYVCETILLGIFTDSGGFRYVQGTLTECMNYSAEIIKEKDIKPDRFLSTLYVPKLRSLKAESSFYHNLNLGKVKGWPDFAYTYITKDQAEEFTNSEVREARAAIKDRIKYVKGCGWSFVFSPEIENRSWSFSFRSTPRGSRQLNVKSIALNFGGGGHEAACGVSLEDSKYWKMSAEELLEMFLSYLKTHKPTYRD